MNFEIKKNELHYYVDLLREKVYDETENSLHNVIRTMSASRHSYVCYEDFSNLDFGNIQLSNIHFSINGKFPSIFKKCIFNNRNFINGHVDDITCADYSGDGKYIITGSTDGSALIWELETGTVKHKLSLNDSCLAIHIVSFSYDSKRCLIACGDNSVVIFDVETGRMIFRFNWYKEEYTEYCSIKCMKVVIRSAVFSPDGKRCVIGSCDGKIFLWSLETGELVSELVGHSGFVDKILFAKDGKLCLTCDHRYRVLIWDVETGQKIHEIGDGINSLRLLAVSPDGKSCIISHNEKTCHLYNLGEPFIKIVIRQGGKVGFPCRTFDRYCELYSDNDDIMDAVFFPDSQKCITASIDTITVWDAITGEYIRSFKESKNKGTIWKVCISPNGKYCLLLKGINTVLWDMKNEKVEYCFNDVKPNSNGFSFDGKHIILYSCFGIRIYDVNSGKIIRYLDSNYLPITAASFTNDGKRCCVSSAMGVAIIIDTFTCKIISKLVGHTKRVISVAFSHDGSKCLTGSEDKTAILWDVNTGVMIHKFEEGNSMISHVSFSDDETECLIGTYNENISIWNLKTGSLIQRLNEKNTQIGYKIFNSISGVHGEEYLVNGHSFDGFYAEIRRTGGHLIRRLKKSHTPFYIGAFSHDRGKCIIEEPRCTISVWDAKAFDKLFELNIDGSAVAITFSPNDKSCYICTRNKMIILNIETGKIEQSNLIFAIPNLYIDNCNFSGSISSADIKNLLYQQGAIIE